MAKTAGREAQYCYRLSDIVIRNALNCCLHCIQLTFAAIKDAVDLSPDTRCCLDWFFPREAMLSAVFAVVVCLSVCLSHSGIVSKRLHILCTG